MMTHVKGSQFLEVRACQAGQLGNPPPKNTVEVSMGKSSNQMGGLSIACLITGGFMILLRIAKDG